MKIFGREVTVSSSGIQVWRQVQGYYGTYWTLRFRPDACSPESVYHEGV